MGKEEKDSVSNLTERIIKFRDARDWKQFHNPKDVSLSLVLEAGEVMEHFQWKNAEEMEQCVKEHRDEIGAELADVLYWVLLLGNDLGIDVLEALNRKMDENELRYSVEKAKGNHKKYTELE
ncbi:MAG: MazG nucleotide pyrophosphohydrolase [uncultured bacterium]|nr:MAG: MazG nucleotide pyrophosphohydrolase [uncultured bacterium]